ncbi:DUF4338 domain-containing protein [Mucilaginibacter roseus]|uniref:DUF4338 domain-containing protein n=1 Tax=Mucilaginibacter roseus TaxID=1528868 RepID=A0ABS8TZY1_9SPHI|nr:Druantia anti-phage system protein DruA [Mucilaginibacter roseus]MCD8739370.1 DUF4338 domain-containing protein [Mucilaginibacter roseus]
MEILKLPVETSDPINDVTLEDQVIKSICRDLERLNWKIKLPKKKDEYPTLVPPEVYTKEVIQKAMSYKRLEIIEKNKTWIDKHLALARKNLADGTDVLNSSVEPVIEICTTEKQHDLFRIFRYFWSSPYSEYVGRRIKLIIRDNGLPSRPVIGIAALGSPIIHIPERDEWIGWDIKTRTKNLIYTMDAYVIGALPPYNYLLGGKLMSLLLASKEVREIYEAKYKNQITFKEKRVANNLAGLFTTSLYGRSSQYNRLKFDNDLIYKVIGQTKGYGTLHLSEQTIQLMIEMLRSKGIIISHKFGDGPSWVMRVIRAAGEFLNFDGDFLLKHSFKRNIYFVPHAKNYKEFLTGQTDEIQYFNRSLVEITCFWQDRWLNNRRNNTDVISDVLSFKAKDFSI